VKSGTESLVWKEDGQKVVSMRNVVGESNGDEGGSERGVAKTKRRPDLRKEQHPAYSEGFIAYSWDN